MKPPYLKKVIPFIKESNSDDFNVSEASKIIGSFLIVLSGLLLYLDKAMVNVDISVFMPEHFNRKGRSELNFIWILAESISPILIIIGHHLKAYFYAYIVPIYCYVLQSYHLFIDQRLTDYDYEHTYALGITLIIFIIMHWARNAAKTSIKMEIEEAKAKIKELMDEDS